MPGWYRPDARIQAETADAAKLLPLPKLPGPVWTRTPGANTLTFVLKPAKEAGWETPLASVWLAPTPTSGTRAAYARGKL